MRATSLSCGLRDGRLVIHSTAPFQPEDVSAIGRFGQPGWLVEATLMHDTFARAGREAFPKLPYLAPAGFAQATGLTTRPLLPPPDEWKNEIDLLEIEGLRWPNEHVFFHRASRTAIVGDPAPMSNVMASFASVELATRIASRSVQFGDRLHRPSLVSAVARIGCWARRAA